MVNYMADFASVGGDGAGAECVELEHKIFAEGAGTYWSSAAEACAVYSRLPDEGFGGCDCVSGSF